MKAAILYGKHDLRIESVAEPGDPATGEVLLEVLRAAICGTDSSEWDHGPRLVRPGVVVGHEFVGRVIALGDGVSDVAVGDRVVSGAGISCGECDWCRAGRTNLCARYSTLGLQQNGGLAEYVSSPASICRLVPERMTDEAAAMAQPLAVALHAVRRSGVAAGQSCAVVGVGGIGAFIVAGAAAHGVSPLIAIDIDEERLGTAKLLGADATVNVAGSDLAQALRDATGGEGPDVVIESSGAPHAPAASLAGVRRGGRVLIVGMQAAPRELDLVALNVREIEIGSTLAHVCGVDLPESLEILAASNLAETVLDRVIPLDALVDEGIRPLVEHTARGKIVVDPRGA
jgi:(R,R)-butanediol dehydrogenase/meso-butanediol dehydrogenase/diacetyl reductase